MHYLINLCTVVPWQEKRHFEPLSPCFIPGLRLCFSPCFIGSPQSAVRSPQSAILFYTGLLILTDRRRQKPITGSVQIPPYFCHGNSDIIFVERQPRSKGLLSYRNRSNDVAGKTGFQCCLCYGRFHVVCIRNLLSLIYEGKRV